MLYTLNKQEVNRKTMPLVLKIVLTFYRTSIAVTQLPKRNYGVFHALCLSLAINSHSEFKFWFLPSNCAT